MAFTTTILIKFITADFLYQISLKLVKKDMESTNTNSITFLSMTVTETIFKTLAFSRQVYVNPTEFNENPRNGLVADTTSQPNGHDLDIGRLMCTSDIWESHSRTGASSLLCMTPCRLSYTLLAVGACVRKVSTEHTNQRCLSVSKTSTVPAAMTVLPV